MENKYYTPTIEEFHVGFEFESCYVGFNGDTSWQKFTLSLEYTWFWDAYKEDAVETEFRVKYLDKEDLLSLGFTFKEGFHWQFFHGHRYKLTVDIHTSYDPFPIPEGGISITDLRDDYCIFYGKIKNKSEFKKLLTQLEIL